MTDENNHTLNTAMARAVCDVIIADVGPCVNCLLAQTANIVAMALMCGVAEEEWEKAMAEINNDVAEALTKYRARRADRFAKHIANAQATKEALDKYGKVTDNG